MTARRKYRWEPGWNQYVPDGYEESLEPLGKGPLPVLAPEVEAPREAHIAPCACPYCMAGRTDDTKGQRMADYLKAKALEW